MCWVLMAGMLAVAQKHPKMDVEACYIWLVLARSAINVHGNSLHLGADEGRVGDTVHLLTREHPDRGDSQTKSPS